jgi:hypothetical protein
MSSTSRRLAVAAWLAVAATLQVTSVAGRPFTYDEPDHLRYGRQLLAGDAERFDDSKMPVSAANALPGHVAAALPEGHLRRALEAPLAARIPTMVAALALALLAYRWARRLYGDRAGLLALALVALDPNLLAHARLVTTDLWAALAVTLVAHTLWRFFSERDPRSGLAAACALAFAQVCKYSGVFLFPVAAGLAILRFGDRAWVALRERSRARLLSQLGTALRWGAVTGVVTVVLLHAAYLGRRTLTPLADYELRSETFRALQRVPALATPPLPMPAPYLEGLDWVRQRERTGEGYGNIYLLGELRDGAGFLGYYLIAYLFKVPLAFQLLFAWALVRYLRAPERRRFRRDEAFLLVPAAFFHLYLNTFFQAQMGIRYLLVAFPLMHVFTASLLRHDGLRERANPRMVGALLAWAALSVLSYHPHYLPYFNELVPDRKRAYRILADSNLDWGQNDHLLERWRREHPAAHYEPERPVTGTVVARVNFFTGVLREDKLRWMRMLELEPVGHLAYSYLIFEVTTEDLGRLPDRLRPPEIPPAPPRR